jgi:hypothetical protein
MSDNDTRIDILQQALLESDIEPAERDGLADDLRFAQEINGSKDPTLIGIKRLTISGVRGRLMTHKHIKTAIDPHAAACPQSRRSPSNDDAAGVKTEGAAPKALAFIHALTPWKWPLAVAIFSPFAGDVAGKILGFFK